MKKIITILFFCCIQISGLMAATQKVSTISEFNQVVKTLQPGDSLVLAKGVWKDAQLIFFGEGTKEKPITLTVEEYGSTTLEGLSNLKLYGNYLIVDGLVFINGYTPTGQVIEFRKGTTNTANNSILRNCVIDRFNKPDRKEQDAWVNLWGQHNAVEYCYFGGKTNQGVTLIVWPNGEGNNQNYHHIYRNYFAARPRLGSNGGETMRIGTSQVSKQNSNTIVEGNYFERCNGETEIISVKSCENRIIDNLFFECEGSVVLRHGDRNEVSGNYFIGNMKPSTGGVRIINEGHKIFNNYFYGLRGKDFRGPLVIMNGVPNSPENRYHQVKNCEISFNTWIDCELPWQLCVGSDEERSLAPQDVKIANNVVYCPEEPLLIKAFDKLDGIKFEDNLLFSEKGNEVGDGFAQGDVKIGRGQNGIPLALTKMVAKIDVPYVKTDIDGRTRGSEKWLGAMEMNGNKATNEQASKSNCGPKWYSPASVALSGKTIKITASETDALAKAINKSKAGDVIELSEGVYVNSKKLSIPHTLTIRADENAKSRPVIKVDGEATTVTIFEIGGALTFHIDGIAIDGGLKQKIPAKYAFATTKENSDSYNIFINNCDIYDFQNKEGGCVYKAYKTSFADTLMVTNSIIRDSYRGFALNDEKDEKGLYSAEFMTFDNTVFSNIEQWAMDFLRGGNDESTLGGNLIINHCVFDNVANKENQTMIKQTGLISIKIENTIFCNSLAKYPVRLQGRHNTVSYSNVYNAGKISVSQDASIGEGMIYSDPKFEKKTFYKLNSKSPLVGKAGDGKNIGLK
ncbi:MAG: chondroitinase-B domain-containing protein [Dysgonomonas sp.]